MGGQKPRMLSLIFTKLKPYLAMITLQFGYAGMFIITLENKALCLQENKAQTSPLEYTTLLSMNPLFSRPCLLTISSYFFQEMESLDGLSLVLYFWAEAMFADLGHFNKNSIQLLAAANAANNAQAIITTLLEEYENIFDCFWR
ncbi:unnamed protein product [Camellia sinensis]